MSSNDTEIGVRAHQQSLISLANPFEQRFGPEFFKRIPDRAGVYWLVDYRRKLLFISRSRNLRQQLSTYRKVSVSHLSKRQKKLLTETHDVQWTCCNSYHMATLLEQELIRLHRPSYNSTAKTDNYLYLGWLTSDRSWVFAVDRSPIELAPLKLYGAFRGRIQVQRAYAALLRWVWQCLLPATRPFPPPLTKLVAPSCFQIDLRQSDLSVDELHHCQTLVEEFLRGQSDELLHHFQDTKNPSLFERSWSEQDLQALQRFFRLGPFRNRNLRESFNLSGQFLDPLWLEEFSGATPESVNP